MALTMTRTRTQTALTKLAQLVANLHGELEMVERLMKERPEHLEVLATRRLKLQADRDALYLTLKQFDPELDPVDIGVADQWLLAYGRRGSQATLRRYMESLINRGGWL